MDVIILDEPVIKKKKRKKKLHVRQTRLCVINAGKMKKEKKNTFTNVVRGNDHHTPSHPLKCFLKANK